MTRMLAAAILLGLAAPALAAEVDPAPRAGAAPAASKSASAPLAGQSGASEANCFGSGLVCTRTAFGLLMTKEHDPKKLDGLLSAARASYKTRFGAAPTVSAFLEDDVNMARLEKLRPALLEAGYAVTLPWPAPSVFKAALAPQEGALKKQLWYLPGPLQQQAIDKAMTQILDLISFEAIAHEYGHFWLIDTFWGADALKDVDKGHYGGPAADWLDETAAVLMEPPAFAATRREGLVKARKSKEPYLTPLATFLTMPHPTLKSANPERPGAGKPRVSIDVASGGKGQSAQTLYYVQCWAFAQFLIETSGRPDIFAAIATSSARGETFAQWLAKEGAQNGLPKTVAALDVQWRAWLDKSYPK